VTEIVRDFFAVSDPVFADLASKHVHSSRQARIRCLEDIRIISHVAAQDYHEPRGALNLML
jgi:hypothetical protein